MFNVASENSEESAPMLTLSGPSEQLTPVDWSEHLTLASTFLVRI